MWELKNWYSPKEFKLMKSNSKVPQISLKNSGKSQKIL
jgi:hypothetical protein